MPQVPASLAPLLAAGQQVSFSETATLVTPLGNRVPLPLVDGGITVDRGRINRREAAMIFPGELDRDTMRPQGQRVLLERVYRLPSGREHRVGLGEYRVTEAQRTSDGRWSVKGKSREAQVAKAAFLSPRTLANKSVCQHITSLIREAVPSSYVSVQTDRDRPAATVVYESDRWGAVDGTDESLARGIGAEVYCDGYGVFQIVDAPDGASAPVWTPAEGLVLFSEDESLTEDQVFNVVVCRGNRPDSDGPIPTGVWWDDNAASPTYVGDAVNAILRGTLSAEQLDGQPWGATDGFGWLTRTFDSPLVLTDGQARQAARSFGKSNIGVLSQLTLTGPQVPWLEGGDTITVPRGAYTARHTVQSYTLGVGASRGEPMQLVTKEVAA